MQNLLLFVFHMLIYSNPNVGKKAKDCFTKKRKQAIEPVQHGTELAHLQVKLYVFPTGSCALNHRQICSPMKHQFLISYNMKYALLIMNYFS